jgi:hypothetical protein
MRTDPDFRLALNKTITFDILRKGDKHLKGNISKMAFYRIYLRELVKKLVLLPSLWLQRELSFQR